MKKTEDCGSEYVRTKSGSVLDACTVVTGEPETWPFTVELTTITTTEHN